MIFLHLCFSSSLPPLGQMVQSFENTLELLTVLGFLVELLSSCLQKRNTKHHNSIIKIVHMTFWSHTTNTDQFLSYALKTFPSTELLTWELLRPGIILQMNRSFRLVLRQKIKVEMSNKSNKKKTRFHFMWFQVNHTDLRSIILKLESRRFFPGICFRIWDPWSSQQGPQRQEQRQKTPSVHLTWW